MRDAPRDPHGPDDQDASPGGKGGAETPSRDSELAQLLDDVTAFVTDYSVWPRPVAASIVALWVAHTWVLDRFDSTPRLAILSAEKQSGKTRILEIAETLVREPQRASDVSAATLFRTIKARRPTLLIDETDVLFRNGNESADAVRAAINAGYRRGNPVLRCVGHEFTPTPFDTFAPVALAGIGELPETILDRSITLRIRRRKRSEPVTRWRQSEAVPRGHKLRDRLATWARRSWTPEYPPDDAAISDRLADVWEPLFVLADRAGGRWPALARRAVSDLTETVEVESLPLRLLREIREHWPEVRQWWGTTDLLLSLHTIQEGPWAPGGPFGERGLTPHRLSRILHSYRISSCHNAEGTARGFLRYSFLDAWDRYLPPAADDAPPTPQGSVGTVATVTENLAAEVRDRLREPL